MVEISAVLSATSWVQLGVPKNKIELRKLQAELHPDVCKDHRANGAFANLMKLYNGPDYDLRVASGVATGAHQIVWTPKPTFEDRLTPARTALTKLHNLKGDFARFFPENQGNDPKELTVAYESGWWFLNSYTSFDSRTVVWIAKRLAGALNQSNKLGFAHCNISPATVLIMPEELHNGSHGVQGEFRVAPHDIDIVNWAIDMTGVDSLAVSHYDVFNGLYTSAGIVEELSKPIIIKANGPRREDRIFTWKQQS